MVEQTLCTSKTITLWTLASNRQRSVRPGTHCPHVTWAHVMLRVQFGCERRFNIEFYGVDSHLCHCLRHVISRGALVGSRATTPLTFLLSHISWDVSCGLQPLSIVCRNDTTQPSGQTPHKEAEIKNILFMSAATLKPLRLERYLPRLPGAKSSHEITWHDDMRVCHLTWREDSVSPALVRRVWHVTACSSTSRLPPTGPQ